MSAAPIMIGAPKAKTVPPDPTVPTAGISPDEVGSWAEYLIPADRCLYDSVVFDSDVEKRFVIDYATGQLQQRSYQGNLLYVLR